jgi:AraC-like DNA-binding protein
MRPNPAWCSTALVLCADDDVMIYSSAKLLKLIGESRLDQRTVDELLRQHGTSHAELVSTERNYSFAQILANFRAVMDFVPDKQIAFRAGRRMALTDRGVFGFAVMSQPDLRTGLAFTLNYRSLTSPLIGLDVISDDNSCRLVFSPLKGLSAGDPIYSRVLDFNFGMFSALIEDATGRSDAVGRFRISDNGDRDTVLALAQTNFAFERGGSENSIVLAGGAMDLPLKHNSAVGASVASKICDEILRDKPGLSDMAVEVRACLISNVRGPTTATRVADELGMSERSLRRRLAMEGVNFRDLKQEVQNALARRYLEHTVMTVVDIAKATGFSDVANFRRSFRRRYGASPNDFRRGIRRGEHADAA